jgi:hypothetical protein
MNTITALGFRLVREAALRELGMFAKNIIAGEKDESPFASQDVEGGTIRYTPAL